MRTDLVRVELQRDLGDELVISEVEVDLVFLLDKWVVGAFGPTARLTDYRDAQRAQARIDELEHDLAVTKGALSNAERHLSAAQVGLTDLQWETPVCSIYSRTCR